MTALLSAVALQLIAGTAALMCSRSPRLATALGAGGAVIASAIGLGPTLDVLFGAEVLPLRLAWDATHGPLILHLDALSAFFLLPVLGLSALAAVYGAGYLYDYRRRKSLGPPWFFFNLFVAGMVGVLLARSTLVFLLAWEVMSVAAFFLVTFEHEQAEVRWAGWVYLIATHLGVAFLFVAWLLLGWNAGSQEFEAFGGTAPPRGAAAAVIFLCALIGFGAKAGLVPFHVWLPEAHPVAPSHVSALMSGVMIKMGFYGLLRVVSYLGAPALWWGPTLAGFGLVTAVTGIAMAVQPRDIKRVLAYSSIENVGLIALALGVGLWGWANHQPLVAALGMTAGLLHVWNHALMKGLMFFAAGSILHGAHTKDMEKLGGLLKRMPWTAGAMMVGAVAIAALPPLNGFASKWLIYLSLLQCALEMPNMESLPALLAVAVLALVGGLAAVAFVRLTGIVLLGSPRSEAARHAHESSPWLLGPMLVLVLLCLGAAVVPATVATWLGGVLDQFPGRDVLGEADAHAPETRLSPIGTLNAVTLVVIVLGSAGFIAWSRRAARAHEPTWGCGYVRPTPRMQYTGRSFTEMLADRLLPRALRPRISRQAPRGLFPKPGSFGSETPDPISARVYEPFFRGCAVRFSRLRILQQGSVHIYLLYITAVVVLAMAWVSVRRWWGLP